MKGAAIDIQNISHSYGERRALHEVCFDVQPAETFALLGPNGGGKTTLLRILTTLMKPTSGTALILGDDVASDPQAVRRHIGVTFQSPSLDAKLTVRENLICHGHLYGMRGGSLRRRVDEVLGWLNVFDRVSDFVSVLSGGLQRRVEIAKSLLHEPKVLMLDEPGTGLDPGARRDLREIFSRLTDDGVTVFLTTHLMEEAEPCSRVAILEHGKLVAIGTPAELRGSIGGDVIQFETKDAEALRAHLGDGAVVYDGLVRVEREAGHKLVASVMEAFNGHITAVHVTKPTLGDVFLDRTGHDLSKDPPTSVEASRK